MTIRPVGTEVFHAGGRAGGQRKLTVAFGNFANAPKNAETKNQRERRKWQSKYLKRDDTGDFLCKRFIDHELGMMRNAFSPIQVQEVMLLTRSLTHSLARSKLFLSTS